MMIKDLQTKVTEEGHMEATTYDKFACFCKSKTDEKVEAISEGETDRDALMTKIQDLQAKRAQLDLDIQALNEEIAGYEEQIAEAKKMRSEEVATFDAALTDMTKAISALERAIDTLKASKPSLAQIKSLVRTSLLMADAMDMAPKAGGSSPCSCRRISPSLTSRRAITISIREASSRPSRGFLARSGSGRPRSSRTTRPLTATTI